MAVGRQVEHVSEKRADICNCDPDSMGQGGRSDKEICANARLIAAAPELLEALKGMLEVFGDEFGMDTSATVDYARHAIAKATGMSIN